MQENGVTIKYIRAQFPDRTDENNDIGWIRSDFVQEKLSCKHFKAEPIEETQASGDGLEDENCCRFPLATSAQADYTSGMRQFGWKRTTKNGVIRKHAASDLYHRQYEPVYAIADGEVLRDRSGIFAGDTAATEIRHTGGFIARYGEIASPVQKRGLIVPKKVKAGTLIGYIRKVRGAPSAMLHFELYRGSAVGSLTVLPCQSGSFCRRSDLMNPASYLQKWESSR